MATNLTLGGAAFRLTRPLITTSGSVADVDPTVKAHLDQLNTLLDKRIFAFHHGRPAKGAAADSALPSGNGRGTEHPAFDPNIKELLARPLAPKHPPHEKWADNSLADALYKAKADPDKMTLAECIDLTPELSALKDEFKKSLAEDWFTFDFNTKTVLDGYPAVSDYLLAYAYHVRGLTEVSGLKSFVLGNRLGARNVADYVTVSAVRAIVDQEQVRVHGIEDDGGEVVNRIKAANLSLSGVTFPKAVQTILDDSLFNSAELKLIEHANIGKIPDALKPLLVKYIKNSPVPITKENVAYFLPLFITQITGATRAADVTETDADQSDQDFAVDFFTDDKSAIQVSLSAMRCAAQMFYVMTVGDELDVFDVMNQFTHKYLIRGGIGIEDGRLRDDLQMYVFSNRFTDPRTKKVMDRTRPAERQMFYKQVFNVGTAPVPEDLVPNPDFPRLWKVLILESAKYLERAQASLNPDSYEIGRAHV